ncbi:MAG TPA: transposase [Vicinamibacterales bacterium]|nr:transposase [Vicinamibacterales bacterium]
MPRKPRAFAPGGLTHLTACGVDDQPIFRTHLDRVALLVLLRNVSKRIDWQILTWCFMTTHYHLLLAVGRDTSVPRALQRLNSVYAREFNARHRRTGHVFGARYTDTSVGTDFHRHSATAYILENPVRAGLVNRVEDWPWSGDGTLEPRFLPRASG